MADGHTSETTPLLCIEQCSPEWLTAILRRNGSLHAGHVQALQIDTVPSTTAAAAFVRLEYSAGAAGAMPASLFLKTCDPAKLPKLPADVVLGDAIFYRRIGTAAPCLPVPLCYDAVVDENPSRYHLLLEDLSQTHAVAGTSARPDQKSCLEMMECLADLHAYWWKHPRLVDFGGAPAADEPGKWVRAAQDRLPGFLDAVGNRLTADTRLWYERFAQDYGPAYCSIFRADHMTVVHGDAHPYNILLPRLPGGSGRIVDWQFHHVGIGTQDIRHTLGLHWSAEARRSLEPETVKRYHQRLLANGVTHYNWDDCWNGYRVGMIDNLFMPMWQWALDMPQEQWFPTIERAVTATRDLNCVELLS